MHRGCPGLRLNFGVSGELVNGTKFIEALDVFCEEEGEAHALACFVAIHMSLHLWWFVPCVTRKHIVSRP